VSELNKVEVGFDGQQVISLRLGDDELTGLRKQLPDGGWLTVGTEDGEVDIDLGKVAFLRVASGGHSIGFGN
jgi:hypothetical protein